MLNHFLLLLCWPWLPWYYFPIALSLWISNSLLPPVGISWKSSCFLYPHSPQSNPVILLQLELLPLTRLLQILSLPLLFFRKILLWISGCYRHFSECICPEFILSSNTFLSQLPLHRNGIKFKEIEVLNFFLWPDGNHYIRMLMIARSWTYCFHN